MDPAPPSREGVQLPRCTPSISPSFTPQLRPGSLGGAGTLGAPRDTPMSLYLAARNRPHARRTFYRRDSGLVPLSALSSVQPTAGKTGGAFCSTTKVKCVPLTGLFSHHHFTPHSLRNVSLHAQRYTPAPATPSYRPVISYSMVDVHKPRPGLGLGPGWVSSRQREHVSEREGLARKAKSLQQLRNSTPHRLSWAFYMNGEPVQMFNKEEITPEELQILHQATLSQNPALFYGTGIKSSSVQAARQVSKFERQLKGALDEMTGIYEYGGLSTGASDHEQVSGRYSRLSRTVTPGSPILEEPAGEMSSHQSPSPLSPLQETFLTDTGS